MRHKIFKNKSLKSKSIRSNRKPNSCNTKEAQKRKARSHMSQLTVCRGEDEVVQVTDIIGFDADILPDALGREGRAPVPAKGTLLL